MPAARIGDIDMFYQEAGNGPPLVLLHGLGNCAEDWEFQVAEFSKSYRVIVPELRGFGRTPAGEGAVSIQRMAADVWALFQKLNLAPALLVGYSMGGAVAQQFSLDHPGAVTRLVVANTVPTFMPRTLRQRFEIWYRMIVIRLLGPRRLAEIAALRMFPGPEQDSLRQKVIERSRYNSTRNYTRALRALTSWSVMARLGELKIPVLVLAAEHDYFPREDSVRFAHALPRGRFHCFDGAHHGLPAEMPDAFNAAVLRFFGAP